MKVYVLTGHQHGESWLVGLYTNRKDAWREALSRQRSECEQELNDRLLLGKRERFDDGTFGEWWSDMYRRHPDHYTVREESLRGSMAEDRALAESRAEVEESDAVITKLAKLLAETAVVIKGPEPDMTRWSYHDIPDGVRAIKARAERLAGALLEVRGCLVSSDPHAIGRAFTAIDAALQEQPEPRYELTDKGRDMLKGPQE